MAKQTVDINILGIDKRPINRQHSPGLCNELINLQPSGPEESPYWEPVPNVNELKNSSGATFTAPNQQNIIRAAWHIRNNVGLFSETDSESLRRLAVFYNDGMLKLLDPDMGTWGEVFSMNFNYGAGEYDARFILFNQSLVVSVIHEGQAKELGIIVDDRFIVFDFPELPIIHHYATGEEMYDPVELNNGIYDGMHPGSLILCYAYKLHDGTLIKQSAPFSIQMHYIETNGEVMTWRLGFVNEGWRQKGESANMDFWQDYISSVVVLAGGYIGYDEESHSSSVIPISPLENIQFYEIASFDSISPDDQTLEDRTVIFSDHDENITSYPLANVSGLDTGVLANVIFTYNSQLLLGDTRTDLSRPEVPEFMRYYNAMFFASTSGSGAAGKLIVNVASMIPHLGNIVGGNPLDFFSVTGMNISNISFASAGHGGRYSIIEADVNLSNDFDMRITGPQFTVLIEKDDFINGGLVPIERYDDADGVEKRAVKIGVDIETEDGTIQRVSEEIEIFVSPITYVSQNFFHQWFRYPDNRARRLYVWENQSGSYVLINKVNLTSSRTQNFSYVHVSALLNSGTSESIPVMDESVNQRLIHKPNRVQVSEVNQPITFLANKVYYIGDTRDKITAFAVNTLAVSQGQFGQYPVYVFMENMIYALEQNQDPSITFSRISPVSMAHGVADDRSVTNVDRSIVFVYKDGIFVLQSDQPEEIGQSIGNYPGSSTINFSSLRLASRQRGGVNELLASDGNVVYVYNMKYGRWYQVDRERKFWIPVSGELYGVDGDGKIYDEHSHTSDSVPVSFDMDPIHFLQPDILKRLYALYLRGSTDGHTISVTFEGSDTLKQSTVMAMRIKHRSTFSFRIQFAGDMEPGRDYLQAISAEIEARYPQRTKIGA